MANVNFTGKQYINLLRASTNMQDTSLADQKVVNDKHAQDKLGMIVGSRCNASGCIRQRRPLIAADLKELDRAA